MLDSHRFVRLPFAAASWSPKQIRLAFGLAFAAIILITCIRYYSKAEKPSRLGELTRTAFLRWRPQLHGLETGTNIYAVHNYPNPPIMAMVLYPFAKLPPLVGAMTWFWLKVGMVIAMIGWVAALFRRPGVRTSEAFLNWGLPLAIVLALPPILGDLAHGNVNLFIGFLVVGSLFLFTRRWDVSAGLVLSLAIACKVTPALFVPYFLWKRSWKLLAGCVLGLALWLFVVPGVLLGSSYNETLLTSWWTHMVKPFVLEGKVTTEHHNQSLPGLSYRLLTAEPSFLSYDDEEGKPFATAFHNIATLSPMTVQILLKSAMLLFAGAIVFWCRWPTHRADVPRAGPLMTAEFSLVIVGMLLFSERTWKHHAVMLIVPFAVLVSTMLNSECVPSMRKRMCVSLLVIGSLLWVPSLLPEQLQDLAMVYGSYTAAFALLFAANAYLLREAMYNT